MSIRYVRTTVVTQHGPVTLTAYTPEDASWIAEQIRQLPYNLHAVQSAVVTVGDAFIVLEREPFTPELQFLCQAYCPNSCPLDLCEQPEIDVLDYYPSYCL